MKYFNMTRL